MRYRLYFPAADERGRTMLDYFGATSVADAARGRPYELVYEGEIPTAPNAWATELVLDAVWKRHNVGDLGDGNRPLAQSHRSMCVGDIVVTETGAYITERFGFEPIADDAVPEGVKRGTTQFDWGI